MIGRLVRLIGWRTLANLALLLAVLGSLGWGISSVVNDIQRSLLVGTIASGLCMALILARAQLSGGRAILFFGFTGVGGSIFYFAGLSNPLVAIIRALGSIPDWLLTAHAWPELTPLVLAWQQFVGQLSALLIRTVVWFTALLQGDYGVDPVVTSLLWVLALWLISVWAAWVVFRLRRPLPAIAPAGILLAGVLNYTHGNAIFLVPLVTATLLLMALSRYEVEEQYWLKNRIDYAEDIRLDMLTVIPLLVLGLTIFATFTPSLSVKQIVQLVREIADPYQAQVESLTESLGLRQPPAIPAALGPLRSPGLPQQHLLGSGPELSQQVVMVIQTGDLPPRSTLELLPHPPVQYYWRSLTYDRYTGRGWATSPTESIRYLAGQPAVVDIPTESPSIRMIEQSVQYSQDNPGILFATGLLVTADVDFEVAWRYPTKDTADAFGITAQAQSYTASSLLTTPSIDQMRTALPVYPDWVIKRYLSLPESLPQRVRDLALDLTRGQATIYDQAASIETFLRKYPYSLDVPTPPANQDVADFFLFELQRGYCDYYATAMVVLSRAAGLPARLVSGYASGSYDAPNARYVVTADNAHSWAEIYFPGIGWVEFEPTGGLPAITRQEDQAELPAYIGEPKPMQRFNLFHWLQGISWLPWFWGLICSLITAVALWYMFELWRLRRMPSQLMLDHVYQRLQDQGGRLAVGQQSGDTPFEFAARLSSSIDRLISRGKFSPLLHPAIGEIERLVRLYALVFYSPRHISPGEHLQAVHTWMRLRWRLKAARLSMPIRPDSLHHPS
jgi:transglutaminase-like putative cysteine protease